MNAYTSINVYGLSNVTVAKVAETAGLSQGIVNFHFKGKNDLLLSTLKYITREYCQTIQRVFSDDSEPLNTLKSVIRLNFDPQLCDLEKIAAWKAFWGECSANKDYAAVCRDADQLFREHIVTITSQLASETGKTPSQAVAIGRALSGLINEHLLEYLLNPQGFDPIAAKQTCYDFLDAFFTEQPNTLDDHKIPFADPTYKPEVVESLSNAGDAISFSA